MRAGLAAVEESCGTAQTLLAGIQDEPQQGDVTRRLAGALTELRSVKAVLDGLSTPADEAVQWAALAVGDTLERWTREIRDSLETLRVQATRCVADLEAEFALASEAGTPEPAERWTIPERHEWVRERLADEDRDRAKPQTSPEPWGVYQRKVAGGVEVLLSAGEKSIWADGLVMDQDEVVAVEAKFVARPGRSMYEGQVPPKVEDMLLSWFDDEIRRYSLVVSDPGNPVGRLRIVSSTRAAAEYLEKRARRILGQEMDVEVRHVEP